MPTTTTKAPALKPFRQGTRARRVLVSSLTYTGSAAGQRPAAITLPSTGYLSRIILDAYGTIDQADNAGALGVDGYAGLYQQVVLQANLGSAAIVQASGAGLDMAARWHGSSRPVSNIFSLGTVAASPFKYSLPIEIAMNHKRQFSLGLINLQDPQIQVQLAITFNPVTSIASHAATTAGTSITVDIWMEYFEVAQPSQYAQPMLAIARILEDQYPQSTQVGQNLYQIPRLGVMTDATAIVYANSLRATPTIMNQFQLRLNKTDYIESRSGQLQAVLDALTLGPTPGVVPGATPLYGQANPQIPGTVTMHLWDATDVPDNGDWRDCLDTLEATTSELLLTIPAGTVVVASDIIRIVRRTFQTLG